MVMGLPRCDKITRTTLISIVITAMVLVGGCTRMVSGRRYRPAPSWASRCSGRVPFPRRLGGEGSSRRPVRQDRGTRRLSAPRRRHRDAGDDSLPGDRRQDRLVDRQPGGPANRASRPPSGWCRRCRRGSASGST
ncbi:putative hydrolase [Mycobacterium xenopi 3993]|nr:putative hydrolase [Mycobacterium xenopi 3993]